MIILPSIQEYINLVTGSNYELYRSFRKTLIKAKRKGYSHVYIINEWQNIYNHQIKFGSLNVDIDDVFSIPEKIKICNKLISLMSLSIFGQSIKESEAQEYIQNGFKFGKKDKPNILINYQIMLNIILEELVSNSEYYQAFIHLISTKLDYTSLKEEWLDLAIQENIGKYKIKDLPIERQSQLFNKCVSYYTEQLFDHHINPSKIKDGKLLDHIYSAKYCSRACCNPTHVSPVTPKQNTHRGKAILFKGTINDY